MAVPLSCTVHSNCWRGLILSASRTSAGTVVCPLSVSVDCSIELDYYTVRHYRNPSALFCGYFITTLLTLWNSLSLSAITSFMKPEEGACGCPNPGLSRHF